MAKKKETGLGALQIDAEIKQKTKSPSKKAVSKASGDEARKALITRLSPDIHKQLRLLSVEEGETVQALMEHAIDLLFAEKGKPTSDSLISR